MPVIVDDATYIILLAGTAIIAAVSARNAAERARRDAETPPAERVPIQPTPNTPPVPPGQEPSLPGAGFFQTVWMYTYNASSWGWDENYWVAATYKGDYLNLRQRAIQGEGNFPWNETHRGYRYINVDARDFNEDPNWNIFVVYSANEFTGEPQQDKDKAIQDAGAQWGTATAKLRGSLTLVGYRDVGSPEPFTQPQTLVIEEEEEELSCRFDSNLIRSVVREELQAAFEDHQVWMRCIKEALCSDYLSQPLGVFPIQGDGFIPLPPDTEKAVLQITSYPPSMSAWYGDLSRKKFGSLYWGELTAKGDEMVVWFEQTAYQVPVGDRPTTLHYHLVQGVTGMVSIFTKKVIPPPT